MISQIILFLFIISGVGIILLKKVILEKRFFVLLPAGMMLGTAAYIFLLNLVFKIIHGPNGIILSTLCFLALGIFLLVSQRKHFKANISIKNLISYFVIFGLIFATIYFARLKMTSILPVADSNMQWAYAASFARGNYPLMTPWQPDLNPNYHLGAYFLEGAIYSIFRLPLIAIHSILNTYYLIAGALFAMFIFWERRYSFRNLWLVIGSLVLYISFGVIILLFPGQNFDISTFTKFPEDIIAKGTAGAALVDLNSLSYLPARSLSIGMAFLFLYFAFAQFKRPFYKILSLSLLLSTIALVEESMFLPIYLTLGIVFVCINKARMESLKILLLTAAIVLIQGGFLSEFLSQKESDFNMYLPFRDQTFFQQAQRANNPSIIYSNSSTWFVPSPLWLALLIIFYSLFKKNKQLSILGVYSFAALLCFIVIEYKYSPSNNIRFYNFAFIASGTGIVYLIYDFLKSKTIRQNLISFFIVSPFILIPTLLPAILNQKSQINEAGQKNIRSQLLIESNPKTPFEEVSNWASLNLPLNTRLITLDTDQPVPYRALQFQYKGIYTMLGPQYVHTTRPEPGVEYFDLSLTLNPSLFQQTKTEYLYIESKSNVYRQLPEFRKKDLENPEYFQILKSIESKDEGGVDIFFRLYKVLPSYLDENIGGREIIDGTLTYLKKIIPQDKTVYIGDYGDPPMLSFWYRMTIILALKDKDIRRNLSQTDYQAIETEIPYTNGSFDEDYEYYILGPKDIPFFPSKLIWSNLYANCWKRIRP